MRVNAGVEKENNFYNQRGDLYRRVQNQSRKIRLNETGSLDTGLVMTRKKKNALKTKKRGEGKERGGELRAEDLSLESKKNYILLLKIGFFLGSLQASPNETTFGGVGKAFGVVGSFWRQVRSESGRRRKMSTSMKKPISAT